MQPLSSPWPLWQEIGSEDKLRSILTAFYEKQATDPLISFFFTGKDLPRIIEMQMRFLMKAFKVTTQYTGKPPSAAHTSLAPILAGHFDRRLVLLRETLNEFHLSKESINAWVSFEASFRDAIVSEERPTQNPLTRFDGKAENYHRFRPTYPSDWIFSEIEKITSFSKDFTVAEIGAGTGIFSTFLAQRQNLLYVVEPNAEMMSVCKKTLSGYKNVVFLQNPAEHTQIPDQSIEVIFSVQAFHWFNLWEAKQEFLRITKPKDALVCLVWNALFMDLDNKDSKTNFTKTLREIIEKWSVDYKEVKHTRLEEDGSLHKFFAPHTFTKQVQYWKNELTWDQLLGLIHSYSYMPTNKHSSYQPMITALRLAFDQFQTENKIELSYETDLFIGTIK